MKGVSMLMARPANFDHAVQVATRWVHDVAQAFPTEDSEFAFRALRAWLHTLRDRLTVEAAAHFGAQLPELLRGTYYEGWNPSDVPKRYDSQAYIARFAQDAGISRPDVPKTAAAVTSGLQQHLSAGQLDKALDQLPNELRALLHPPQPTLGPSK
jgi:uncharacterized protein (DUF2267 family)